MTLPRKIYLLVYWAVVLAIGFVVFNGGHHEWVLDWIDTVFAAAWTVGYGIAALVTLMMVIFIQDFIWTGLLYMVDSSLGITKYNARDRDILRRAISLENRGKFVEAGPLFEEVSDLKRASECYIKGQKWDDAARNLEYIGDLKRAAKMYEKAGAFEKAALIYDRIKDEAGAMQLHLRSAERALNEGRLRGAVDHFMEARQPLRAAEVLERMGNLEEAGLVYMKAGFHDKAADCFRRQLVIWEEGIANGTPPPGGFGKVKILRERTAEALEAADLFDEAAEMQKQAENWGKAGELYAKAGNHSCAAECFLKAGDNKSARESMRLSGNVEQLKEYTAIDLLESGQFDEAARQFMAINKLDKAMEAYRRGRNPMGMGEVYRRMGRFVSAAEQFSLGGDLQRAAEMYEEGNDFAQAADIYREIGNIEKAVACMDREGNYFEAGLLYEKMGQTKRAITCMQKVKPGQPQHRRAMAMLGRLFTLENQFDDAIRFFNQAFEAGAAGSDILSDFYKLGRRLEQYDMLQEAVNVYRRIQSMDYGFEDVNERLTRLRVDQPGPGMGAAGAAAMRGGALGGQGFPPMNAFPAQGMHPGSGRYPDPHPPSNPSGMEYPTVAGAGGMSSEQFSPTRKMIPSELRRTPGMLEAMPSYDSAPPQGYAPPIYGGTQAPQQLPIGYAPAPGSSPSGFMAAQPGGFDQSDRYELLEEIGRGGMGVVYKAKDTMLDRVVALKMLPSAICSESQEDYQNFLREARTVAKLTHKNIVTIYDIGRRADRYYFSMEYINGSNLRRLIIERGAPDPKITMHIAMDICSALDYAHSRNIIHRDIKPGNILISDTDEIKIVDFGLAKIISDHPATHDGPDNISSGFMMGTPHYMSPEQIKGERIDHRTDIYAFGLTLYFMLTGRSVFDVFNCKSPMEVVDHQINTILPPPSAIVPTLPESLDFIYTRCTEKDRDRRFSSMREVIEHLAQVAV